MKTIECVDRTIFKEVMIEAYRNAALSPDPSSQNGAILLSSDLQPIGQGWNWFPCGVQETSDRLNDREQKYPRINHAERVSIYSAARSGLSTRDAVLVCPWLACTDCAKAIIDCGLSRVISHAPRMALDTKNWGSSISIALEMLNEAGIIHEQVQAPLNLDFSILVSGKPWTP